MDSVTSTACAVEAYPDAALNLKLIETNCEVLGMDDLAVADGPNYCFKYAHTDIDLDLNRSIDLRENTLVCPETDNATSTPSIVNGTSTNNDGSDADAPPLTDSDDSDESDSESEETENGTDYREATPSSSVECSVADSSELTATDKAKTELQNALVQGGKACLEKAFRSAAAFFQKALNLLAQFPELEFSEQQCALLTFALGLALNKCETQNSLLDAIKHFQQIIENCPDEFHILGCYGLATNYSRQNRFTEALQPVESALALLRQNALPTDRFWPGTEVMIEDVSSVEKLQDQLEDVLTLCKSPPTPDAVCRYSECSGHFKIQIYMTDLDFKGFVTVHCEERCVVEYHLDCWKHVKVTELARRSDKDMLKAGCMTPDCKGIICRIRFHGPDGGVFKEVPAESQETEKNKKHSSKQKQNKGSQHVAKGAQKKEKNQKSKARLAENGVGDDKASTASGSNTATATDSEQSLLKAAHPEPVAVPLLPPEGGNFVTLQKKTNDSEEMFMTTKQKKTKQKRTKPLTMHIDEFVEQTDGFAESATSGFGMRDYSEEFSGTFLKDEYCEIPLANPLNLRVLGSTQVEEPAFTLPVNPWNTKPFIPEQRIELVADPIETPTGDVDIKENIFSLFKSLLERNGPCSPDDTVIQREVEQFPTEAQIIVCQAGGIGKFLQQNVEFTFVDGFICLTRDSAKARRMATERRRALLGAALSAPKQPVKLNPPPLAPVTSSSAKTGNSNSMASAFSQPSSGAGLSSVWSAPMPFAAAAESSAQLGSISHGSLASLRSGNGSLSNSLLTKAGSMPTSRVGSLPVMASSAHSIANTETNFTKVDNSIPKPISYKMPMTFSVKSGMDPWASQPDFKDSLNIAQKFVVNDSMCGSLSQPFDSFSGKLPSTADSRMQPHPSLSQRGSSGELRDTGLNVNKLLDNMKSEVRSSQSPVDTKRLKEAGADFMSRNVTRKTNTMEDVYDSDEDDDDDDDDGSIIDEISSTVHIGSSASALDTFDNLGIATRSTNYNVLANFGSDDKSSMLDSVDDEDNDIGAFSSYLRQAPSESSSQLKNTLKLSVTAPEFVPTNIVSNSHDLSLPAEYGSASNLMLQSMIGTKPKHTIMVADKSVETEDNWNVELEHLRFQMTELRKSHNLEILKLQQELRETRHQIQEIHNRYESEKLQLSLEWKSERITLEKELEKLQNNLMNTKSDLERAYHVVDAKEKQINEANHNLALEIEKTQALKLECDRLKQMMTLMQMQGRQSSQLPVDPNMQLYAARQRAPAPQPSSSSAGAPGPYGLNGGLSDSRATTLLNPPPSATSATARPLAPTSQSSAASVAPSGGGSKSKQNFDKILVTLSRMFPDIKQTDLQKCVQEVRASRGNSLSGLTMQEIVSRVKDVILKQQLFAQRQARAAARGGLASFTLPNYAALGAYGGPGSNSGDDMFEEEEDPCIVCHEELQSGPTTKLDCGHVYHTDCIRKWFKEQNTCPTCRNHALLYDEFPTLNAAHR